jgi:hypothetical protein
MPPQRRGSATLHRRAAKITVCDVRLDSQSTKQPNRDR